MNKTKKKKGIELCKNSKVDFILAVGGGSVIDSAKAIALGDPVDLLYHPSSLVITVPELDSLPAAGIVNTVPNGKAFSILIYLLQNLISFLLYHILSYKKNL